MITTKGGTTVSDKPTLMVIETKGGTTFMVLDGSVTITRHDQPEVVVPEDDLKEFCERFFAAEPSATRSVAIPENYRHVHPHPDGVLEHHAGFVPWVLESTVGWLVQPYAVMCPACGVRVIGGQLDLTIRLWNEKILGGAS
jgi:hypothetical protein